MKLFTMAFAAALVGLMSTTTFAGSKCCPASKKAAKAAASVETASAKAGCYTECLSDAGLSKEQWAQVKSLEAECATADGCSLEAKSKMDAKLATILSADQVSKMKSACETKGCSSQAKTGEAASADQPAG